MLPRFCLGVVFCLLPFSSTVNRSLLLAAALLGRESGTGDAVAELVDFDDLFGSQALHDVSQDELVALHAGLLAEFGADFVEGLLAGHFEQIVHAFFKGATASSLFLGHFCHFVFELAVGDGGVRKLLRIKVEFRILFTNL